MSLKDASIRLFIETNESSVDPFSMAAKKARNNADDSFSYEGMAFTVGERGSVYIDVGINDSVTAITKLCGRRVKWSRIRTGVSQVHDLTQSGHYGSRQLGYNHVKAVIDKTGQLTGKPGVTVEGKSVGQVKELVNLIATGKVAIKLTGEVIIPD